MISPRQAAINIGLKWYAPTDTCLKCHTRALRRVDNGICQGCHPPAISHLKAPPEGVVINRASAILFGYDFYYTGVPCAKGHTAPRYVSTRHCRECLRLISSKLKR